MVQMNPQRDLYTSMKIFKLLIIITFLAISARTFGQDEEAYLDSILTQTVKVEKPVYKPVVGIGYGLMNFYGEVHNPHRSPVTGVPAYKLNMATFLDGKHLFIINFVIIKGSLTGNEHSLSSDTLRNWNFKSDIFSMGINVHYDFGHWIKYTKKNFVRPFVSLGIENLQFNSKTDKYYEGQKYYYWSDGTIRDQAQTTGTGNIIHRDYTYETDLRSLDQNELGSYSQNTFAIPFDIGVDFKVSERINLRIANSLHYTFTDNIDDVSSKGTRRKGDKMNDWYTYSYLSLHMDLFSSPKEITQKLLAAEIDNFDYAMFSDEDNDGVVDLIDRCPVTPPGVPVDTFGCPFDKDKDGVYDYMDKELNTSLGAMVDENGVKIKADDYATRLNIQGITRKEVEAFLMMRRAQNRMKGRSSMPIPAKFKSVDSDGDGYISFDELVKAINDLFDSSSTLTIKDIYELQDFFFEQ
jgi:hypothetical protein